MAKIAPFWGQNNVIGQNFGKLVTYLFSIKVYKNHFSQVYGYKLGQKCHSWGQFGQTWSFLVKMVKIGSFGTKNDVVIQNFGKLIKKFYSKSL